MDQLKIKNKEYQKKYNLIIKNNYKKISEENFNMIKLIILRYKQFSTNEYFIVLALIYGLIFFKVLDKNDPIISYEDKEYIKKIIISYNADISGDAETFLKEMINYDEDLFMLKIIIKYTILNSEDKYLNIIDNRENYFKSIGYIIPLLTLKDSPFILFYQDYYFKKIYPEEYAKIKNKHLKQTSKLELPGEYIINVINSLNNTMNKGGIFGNLSLRKKSYFSMYGKYKQDDNSKITDHIGIKLVFKNINNLNKFKSIFERDFICLNKKDYIKNPKENGYKSIHYSFIYPFRNSEILVELQIKTNKMEKFIKEGKISHFYYTIMEKKWDPIFKEVHRGYELMKKFLDIKS